MKGPIGFGRMVNLVMNIILGLCMTLVILTAVEKVAIHFGKEDEKWLSVMTPDEADKYCAEGEFAPGSMQPKVEAAAAFARSGKGREALITLLEKAHEGIIGKTGTIIRQG